MVGAVGTDPSSRDRLDGLRVDGVDIEYVTRDAPQGGVALIQVEDQGENTITIVPGANGTVSAEQVRDALGSQLHRGDYVCCQLEIPLEANRAALELARRVGARSVLNAAPLVPEAHKLLSGLDVLIVNEIEAAQLLDRSTVSVPEAAEAAEALSRLGPELVVITLGAQGVQVHGAEDQFSIPAPTVSVRDTTGAGDAFVAAFATWLAEGRSLRDAALAAVHSGALAVQRAGAQPSLPTRADLTAVLANL